MKEYTKKIGITLHQLAQLQVGVYRKVGLYFSERLASIFIFIAVLGLFGLLGFVPKNSSGYKLKTIVIDAGHGGKDPGCLGKKHYEKDIALGVALELGKLLKENMPGVKVVFTRKTDVFVELNDRSGIANKNHADLFISLHCNSSIPKAIGSETYVMGLHKSQGNLDVAKRENEVVLKEDNYMEKYDGFDPKSPLAHIIFANFQSAHLTNSLKLANDIERYMKSRTKRKSRGVRQDGFLVLWKTTMPSVLCEIGYLSNNKDEKYLSTKKGKAQIAGSIYRAIRDYKRDVEAVGKEK